MSHDDFDFDPVRGLPEVLPAGERMLWQGSPRWQDMALHAFHVRKVAVYFAVITLSVVVLRLAEGSSLPAGEMIFPPQRPHSGILSMNAMQCSIDSGLI